MTIYVSFIFVTIGFLSILGINWFESHRRQKIFMRYLKNWPHGCGLCAFQRLAKLEGVRCPVKYHECKDQQVHK